jgi:molecular chaperone GrpE
LLKYLKTGAAEVGMAARKTRTKKEIIEELQRLNEEIDHLKDEKLRLLAEIQNLHKRYEREIEEARKSERKAVVQKIAEVIDLIFTAIDGITATADEAVSTGFKMISEELKKKLGQLDITVERPLGKKFDVRYHHAVGVNEVEDVEDDTIVEVLRSGIYYAGEVIRPALVIVARRKNN